MLCLRMRVTFTVLLWFKQYLFFSINTYICYKHIILSIWIGKQAVIAYIYPLCNSLYISSFTVLLCHGSTEIDQAKEADQSSDGFTITDVVDVNDRHYFNIFFHGRKASNHIFISCLNR